MADQLEKLLNSKKRPAAQQPCRAKKPKPGETIILDDSENELRLIWILMISPQHENIGSKMMVNIVP